jgi:ATP-dependent Lon protease
MASATTKKLKTSLQLKPENLRWRCDPDLFEFDSTETIKPIEGILGQERALKSLKLGVDLRAPGYNIYIAGLSGTGKATTVKKILETISSECPPLSDYAYVNNFKDPDRPILLTFPKGRARIFKSQVASGINILKEKIQQAFESEFFVGQKKSIMTDYSNKEQTLLNSFEEKIKKDNFSLGQVKVGQVARPDILPVIEEKPVPIYQLEDKVSKGKLTKEQAQEILKKYNLYQEELQLLFKKGLKISQDFQQNLSDLEKSIAKAVIKGVIDSIKENFSSKELDEYFSLVEEHILENLHVFKGIKPEETTSDGFIIDYFNEYEVNVILDNSETNECPVIIETSPNYVNLFGTIEKINDGKGGWYSDFTKIKAGSLLRANGGYLVLNVYHLFEEPGVWKTLKRVLTYNKLEIQETPGYFQLASTTLKPEPIKIDTKIILIGSQYIYSYLAEHEYDFKKMFKVKADFDYEIKRSDKVVHEYARVIKKLIKEENLYEFDRSAIAYILELSARYAGQKNKLTTRFSWVADLAREASFWAEDDGFQIVSAAHVEKAFLNAKERHGMLESKITDMIDENTLIIDTEGERIGQINGLAVYGADYYSFGRPTRITATVSLGSGSIINVEREAGMSGKHYTKGVLIISGYFRETFGQDIPLSFNANLVFEQSYGTVDGDSASCAEIFALLSTLSGLPINQSLAVTGSLNQKGDVQPIGGVNEKIEGFFDVCKSRGLTGKQGVIIPELNVKELMLREDVIHSVRENKFYIYAIKRVEEGIELLTGVKAGKKTKKGYEPGTVFYQVENRIKDLYSKSRSIKQQGKSKTSRRRK